MRAPGSASRRGGGVRDGPSAGRPVTGPAHRCRRAAAVHDLPGAVAPLGPQADGRRRRATGRGPVAGRPVDVARPQTARAMVAEAAVGLRVDDQSTMGTGKSGVFAIASVHSCPRELKAKWLQLGAKGSVCSHHPRGGHQAGPGIDCCSPPPAEAATTSRSCFTGAFQSRIRTSTGFWYRPLSPAHPHSRAGATGRCASGRTDCGGVPSLRGDATGAVGRHGPPGLGGGHADDGR